MPRSWYLIFCFLFFFFSGADRCDPDLARKSQRLHAGLPHLTHHFCSARLNPIRCSGECPGQPAVVFPSPFWFTFWQLLAQFHGLTVGSRGMTAALHVRLHLECRGSVEGFDRWHYNFWPINSIRKTTFNPISPKLRKEER